jgi:hypothetical protein
VEVALRAVLATRRLLRCRVFGCRGCFFVNQDLFDPLGPHDELIHRPGVRERRSSSSDVSGRIRFASSLFFFRKLSAGSLTACFVPKNCARSLLLVPGLSYLLIRSLSSSSKVGENGAVSFHHSAAAPRNYAVILPRQNAGLVVASFSLHSFKKVRQRQYLRWFV